MKVKYGLSKDFIFTEAVAFLSGKAPLPDEIYAQLDGESKAKAFTVSGYTEIEVLQEFLDCLIKAAEEGKTKEQFREEMNHFLEDHGYEGYMLVEAEQDPAKANPLEYAIKARKFIAEKTGL